MLCTASLAGIVALNTIALIPGASRAVLLTEAYIREIVRWILMSIYLYGLQKGNIKRSMYMSMHWVILYNAYVIITRLVSDYFIGQDQTLLCLLFRIACMTSILTISYIFVDLTGMSDIGATRLAELSLNLACLIYICASYRFVTRLMSHSYTLRYFILLLLLFLLVSVMFAERSAAAQKEISQMKLRETADEYRMKYYRDVQKHNEDIRTLAHDMKNHLLAIRCMAADGENAKIESYIDDMYESFNLNAGKVNTGSELIDSIIMTKIGDSSDLDIHYSVLLDAHLLDKMSDIDVCTLFGNALDNAVEACEKVEDKESRFISIKSGVLANKALVEISNSCEQKPVFKNGLPVTSKTDKESHGIGVKSIKKIVEKYGGMLKIDADSSSLYKMTIMLPLQST